MARHPIQLTIPEPCDESWDEMAIVPGGRHCPGCAKTVVDYSRMTEQEFASFVASHLVLPCGRFRDDQLSRMIELPVHQPPVFRISRRIAAAAILVVGIGVYASAQPFAKYPRTHNVPTAVDSAARQRNDPFTEISGKVEGQGTAVVSGIQLFISGMPTAETLLEPDGGFRLQLMERLNPGQVVELRIRDRDFHGSKTFSIDSIARFETVTAIRKPINNFPRPTRTAGVPIIQDYRAPSRK